MSPYLSNSIAARLMKRRRSIDMDSGFCVSNDGQEILFHAERVNVVVSNQMEIGSTACPMKVKHGLYHVTVQIVIIHSSQHIFFGQKLPAKLRFK